MLIKVKIQTFRESGKYYDEWEHEIEVNDPIAWYDVLDKIKTEKALNKLPQSNMIYMVSESLCGKYGFPHLILK